MTAHCPIPAEPTVKSRSTATLVTLGASSLSNCSHFPLKLYSNCVKPVTLPPGRDRLLRPLPKAFRIERAPTVIEPQVAPDVPAQLLQSLLKRRHVELRFLIV